MDFVRRLLPRVERSIELRDFRKGRPLKITNHWRGHRRLLTPASLKLIRTAFMPNVTQGNESTYRQSEASLISRANLTK